MQIFLSWSGERSRSVALALRDWIPMLLQSTQPWLSDRDIAAGDRWAIEIGKRLEECQFGIICLTRDNTTAPWVLFEAGALSKALTSSSVCPYLLDVDFQEISGPLSQFQAKKADPASTRELIEAINNKLPTPVPQPRLAELFEVLWPKLSAKLVAIPAMGQREPRLRSQPEILEELVGSIRRLDHRVGSLNSFVRSGRSDGRVSLRLTSDEPSGDLSPNTEIITEAESAGQIIKFAAKASGMDPSGFGLDWYLADVGSEKRYENRDELYISMQYAPRVLYLKVTTIPF
jgi:hypothetical protein